MITSSARAIPGVTAWRAPASPPKMPGLSRGWGFATHGGTGQDGGLPGHRLPGGRCRGADRAAAACRASPSSACPTRRWAKAGSGCAAALVAIGLALPPKRITVNLAPADLPKEGSHFDLPIALALLAAMGVLPARGAGRLRGAGRARPRWRASLRSPACCRRRSRRGGRARPDLPRGPGRRGGLGGRDRGAGAALAHRAGQSLQGQPDPDPRPAPKMQALADHRPRPRRRQGPGNAPSARWRSRRPAATTC